MILNPPVTIVGTVTGFGEFSPHDSDFGSSVVVGGAGYVVWDEGSTLFFSKSTNGIVWSTPVLIDTVTDNIQTKFITVEGSNVDIFYQGRTGVGLGADFFVSRSTNGGTSFASPVLIEALTTGSTIWAIDVKGNTIVVVYKDIANSNQLLFKRSTNGGTSFGSSVQISDGLGGAGNSTGIFISAPDIDQTSDGTKITIAYQGKDAINADFDIFEQHSTDSGATFSVPKIISNAGGSGFDEGLKVFRNSNEVLIINFQDGLNSYKSTDNGVTFGGEDTFVADTTCDLISVISDFEVEQDPLDTNKLHLICSSPTTQNMLYTRTVNFGDSWSSLVSIADDPLDSVQGEQSLAVHGDNVFATWKHIANNSGQGERVQVLVRSTDGGTTFSGEEDFIETPFEDWDNPHLNTDGTVLYLIMTDFGDLNSYFEDIVSPATPAPPVFSGVAQQVSFSGNVNNAVAFSDEESGVYWIWEEEESSKLFFSFSENGETNTPILIRGTEGSSVLNHDFNGGMSSIFVSNEDVFILYRTSDSGATGGNGDRDIRLKISNNGGVSFGSEITVELSGFSADDGIDGEGNSGNAIMKKSSDGDLFIISSDDSLGVDKNLVFWKSSNNGLTWNNQGQLDGFETLSGILPHAPIVQEDGIIIDGDKIHLAVSAVRSDQGQGSGSYNFYYVSSDNEGVTWNSAVNVGLTTVFGNEETPTLSKDGNDLLIIMFEHDDVDMHFNHSNDNGVTWNTVNNYAGSVNTSPFCDWENQGSNQDWDYAQVGRTVAVMCGGGNTANDLAFMTISSDMGVNWSAVTEIDFGTGNTNFGTGVFSADEAKSNMAFSWYVGLSTPSGGSGLFKINEIRASSPTQVSDFTSITEFYDEPFRVHNFGDEGKFREPAVHVSGQGLWSSWVGIEHSGQSNDLFFIFQNFPNADNDTPVITVTGASIINLNVGETYVEQGAVCVDLQDGNIGVSIGGDTVITSVADTYTVLYDCIDSDSNQAPQKSRTVIVDFSAGIELTLVDIICDGDTVLGLSEFIATLEICGIVGADPPVITITGDDIVEVVLGDSYSDDGATAFDNGDGDVTANIAVTGVGNVDVNTVGAYLVLYNVDDSNGNSAVEKIRVVLVVTAGVQIVATAGGSAGSPVSTSAPEDTGVEGFTETQQMAFDEALANAIASIPLTEDSFIEELIQTFFEFTVLDSVHDGLVLQSFLDNERLGLRWSTGDDIVIIDAVLAPNPFLITFEQFPVIKDGSGAFVSTDILLYNLEVPRNECGDVVSLNCVQKIRYEIPVTVQAVIDGTQVQDTATITVDLSEEDIDVILLLVIAVGAIPVGAVLINRLRGAKAVGLTTARRISG